MTTTAVSPLATAPAARPRRPAGPAHRRRRSAPSPRRCVVLTTLAVYLQVRDDFLDSGGTGGVPDDFVLPLTPGGMGMVTLLMSVVTVSWAVWALRRDDRPHAYLAVGVTLLLGIAFVNATVYLYQQLSLPLTVLRARAGSSTSSPAPTS